MSESAESARHRSGGAPRVWRAIGAGLLASGIVALAVSGARPLLAGPAGALGVVAIALLTVAMVLRSVGAIAVSVVLLAFTSGLGRTMEVTGGRAPTTLAACTALFLVAELAIWSTELTVRPHGHGGVARGRWASLGVVTALGVATGGACAAVASIGIADALGLIAVALGGVAACMAIGLAVMLALDSRRIEQ